MILTAVQIDEIKKLIETGNEKDAVTKLVEYTHCEEYDARCLVEDYDYEKDFEFLLNKHWIEKSDGANVVYETSPLSRKEKLSLIKIFLPTVIIVVLTIILIVVFG